MTIILSYKDAYTAKHGDRANLSRILRSADGRRRNAEELDRRKAAQAADLAEMPAPGPWSGQAP